MAYAKRIAYIGVEPGTRTVYANRASGGLWEAVQLTKRDEFWDMLALEAQVQICVNQGTEQLEGRKVGDYWDWGGRWALSADGRTATCSSQTLYLDVTGTGPINPGLPIPQPLHLEQRGYDFVDAQGQRIVFPGCDAFMALRQFKDGGSNALQPFFEQSMRLGFKVWRVWSQGSKAQNQVLDLSPKESGYYETVPAFIDCCNKIGGIIPLITAWVDNQDLGTDIDHFGRLVSAGSGGGRMALWSAFNQWTKNQKRDANGHYIFTPWDVPTPSGGVIWSRGSDTDDVQTAPKGAPASELHATRNSFDRALMDATASPPNMRSVSGGGMVWMTEGNPFGDGDGYTEKQAWQLGRCYSGGDWALAVFHDRQSQRGLLMHDDTARCGAAWVKGTML